MNPQPVIHPSLVDAVARAAARRQRVPFQELEDLRSALWVKLLDRDGHVVRCFTGRGSLFSYLVRVAHRLVLDERAARLGRWRPSLQASRMGADAVAWATMVERDGVSPAEAMSRLNVGAGADLARLGAAVGARRRPKRTFVPLDECPPSQLAAGGLEPVQRLVQREACQKVRRGLAVAMRQLTDDERRWLRLRFCDGLRISEIAKRDRRRPMAFYREYSRLLANLRARLSAAGVDAEQVAVALDHRSDERRSG